jgi:4a-hydroxytetrahydrobiopterin dehydratase
MNLADLTCKPVEKGTKPLSKQDAGEYLKQLPQWIYDNNSITREIKFPDFQQAIAVVNQVAQLAERENHHPEINISYNQVRLTLSTHKIGGLSLNDFILAAKLDLLMEKK